VFRILQKYKSQNIPPFAGPFSPHQLAELFSLMNNQAGLQGPKELKMPNLVITYNHF